MFFTISKSIFLWRGWAESFLHFYEAIVKKQTIHLNTTELSLAVHIPQTHSFKFLQNLIELMEDFKIQNLWHSEKKPKKT